MSNNNPGITSEHGGSEPVDVQSAGLGTQGLPGLRGHQALERLRERVEVAARELERLRKDNILLARRIAELEARPEVDKDQAFLVFDEEDDTLRRKVEGFIQAIDAYLARERERAADE